MEGYGFLSAAFAYPDIRAIVIRGISDLIEGKNDNGPEPEQNRQEKASHHASAFAFQLLGKWNYELGAGTEPQMLMGEQMFQANFDHAQGYQAIVQSGGTAYIGGNYSHIPKNK